jgi:hypothetical protein
VPLKHVVSSVRRGLNDSKIGHVVVAPVTILVMYFKTFRYVSVVLNVNAAMQKALTVKLFSCLIISTRGLNPKFLASVKHEVRIFHSMSLHLEYGSISMVRERESIGMDP